MIDTTTKILFCKYEKYVKLRISPREMYPRKYLPFTFDIVKFKKGNQNMKANERNGFGIPCQCDKCNPNTGCL